MRTALLVAGIGGMALTGYEAVSSQTGNRLPSLLGYLGIGAQALWVAFISGILLLLGLLMGVLA